MENDTNPSSETLVGADGNVPAADGGETVGTDTTLAELNKILGGNFKDLPSALKAVQDTKAFVGKRKEDIVAEVRKELEPSPQNQTDVLEAVKQLENRLFFSDNPQYKGYESLIAKMGSNPAEVVASEEFKTVFEKVKVADEIENSKSVVHSSPRLAESKTVIDEAINVANSRSSTNEDVAAVFAKDLIANGQA